MSDHAISEVHERNDYYFRCSCGKTFSTDTGVDRHTHQASIDKLVARVEELEGALREARSALLRHEPFYGDALAVIDRVLEGTE